MGFIRLLNHDILFQIFDWLDTDETISDLLNASKVCKTWHSVAQEVIDRTLTLTIAAVYEERNLRLLHRICLDDGELRKRVRRIVVRDWHHTDLERIKDVYPWLDGQYFSGGSEAPMERWRDTQTQIEGLADCVRVLSLSSFSWTAIPPMPATLLLALNQQPGSCDIEITENSRVLELASWAYTPYFNQTTLFSLGILRHIVKLHVLIAPSDHALLTSLGTFVASRTDSLRSLRIQASGRLWPGDSSVNVHMYYHPKLVQDPRFYLVRGMAWLVNPLYAAQKRLLLCELKLSNFCICGSHPVHLDSLLDPDRLVTLELSCFRFLERDSHFPHLRRLALGFRNGPVLDREKCVTDWPKRAVRDFLLTCGGIQHLELVDRPDILNDDMLHALGPSLKSLDVHKTIPMTALQETKNVPYDIASNDEEYPDRYPDGLVAAIGKLCPRLQSLKISAPAPWPKFDDLLDQIAATFKKLEALTLFRSIEPYQLASGEEDWKSFNKLDVLRIWNAFNEGRDRQLHSLRLCLQNFVEAGRYNEELRRNRIYNGDERTYTMYTVARNLDYTGSQEQQVDISMDELIRSKRAKLEGAPQVDAFPDARHEQLEDLFNKGQRMRLERTRNGLRRAY